MWYDPTMSANELFDIVDDQNRPTGEIVPRVEAHQRGLRHRVAHVYVFRDRDGGREILVHQRSAFKDHSPNTWDPRFGGHIASGKDPLETAVRELEEEAGLSITTEDLMTGPVVRWDEPTNNEFQYLFAYRGDGLDVGVLTFNDGEVQAVKWMDVDEVVRAVNTEADQWTCRGKFGEEIKNIAVWLHTL